MTTRERALEITVDLPFGGPEERRRFLDRIEKAIEGAALEAAREAADDTWSQAANIAARIAERNGQVKKHWTPGQAWLEAAFACTSAIRSRGEE